MKNKKSNHILDLVFFVFFPPSDFLLHSYILVLFLYRSRGMEMNDCWDSVVLLTAVLWMVCMSAVGTNSLTPSSQLRLWCPADDLSGFSKTLTHSQSILRFMLHLCPIPLVALLIKRLLGESCLFIICMATCLLNWPSSQVHMYFFFPAALLYYSFFTVYYNSWLVFIVTRWPKSVGYRLNCWVCCCCQPSEWVDSAQSHV